MEAPPASETGLKPIILDELAKIGSSGPWLWKIFILCVTPNILNGFHVSSYVFLGALPDAYYCVVPELLEAGWTPEQMRNITTPGDTLPAHSCGILNWNYSQLSSMDFDEALHFTQEMQQPETVSCRSRPENYYHYEQDEGTSIVPEWDLVCENNVWRTTVQVGLSIGKFIGASLFGVISDKFGRKKAFVGGATLYIVSGFLTVFTKSYFLFLLGRIGLGSSASGLFYAAFTLLTENIALKHRSWMSIMFTISYPIGMLILTLFAYLLPLWRSLQLALILPGLLLIVHCYFLDESPRWLVSKNREKKAYNIVFGKKPSVDLIFKANKKAEDAPADSDPSTSRLVSKLRNSFREFAGLFSTWTLRRRIFICYFVWCVTSMSYYITAINADNLSANRYMYVAATGLVDIPAYIIPIFILKYTGRRMSSFALYLAAGLSLLAVLAIPREHSTLIVAFAMFGRFGISAVYAVLTLHTAELFPTEIRNSALGTSSTMAHVGSMAAPYIVDLLGMVAWYIPTTICGSSILLAGFLSLLQPETGNRDLKDHVQQEEEEKKINA
ncbi:organic cation transporter protein [Phlebotomus argentipes]|uniref:organic cation transporter protein n=1 Tax=Phlebotomus argentipes TaxID=94469 RepID=UPI0028930541|nr:organic cation transporter protein [Phlebotomus argentipes]